MRSADSTRTVKGAKRRAKRLISFFMVLSGYGAKAHPKAPHARQRAKLSACSLLVIRMKNTHGVSKRSDCPLFRVLLTLGRGKVISGKG